MQRPRQLFAGEHRHHFALAKSERFGYALGLFDQSNGIAIARQAVEAGAVVRREGFEFVERAGVFENLGVDFDGVGGAEHTGAAAGVFFGAARVRRGIGAEKEFVGLRTGNGIDQGAAVAFALDNRQAVKMRAHAADQQVVAVEHQMLRGYGGGQIVARCAHQRGGFGGGDVLEHGFQFGQLAHHRLQHALDKHGFAVENIDSGVGYFAVHQKAHVLLGNFFEHRHEFEQIADAGIGIGGGAGGIEFEGGDAGGFGLAHGVAAGVVGKIERHQRREAAAGGNSGFDLALIVERLRHGGHRRLEIGHHQRAPHLAGAERHNGLERGAVAHMEMEIVGAGNG